jgi:hypothetical protein
MALKTSAVVAARAMGRNIYADMGICQERKNQIRHSCQAQGSGDYPRHLLREVESRFVEEEVIF